MKKGINLVMQLLSGFPFIIIPVIASIVTIRIKNNIKSYKFLLFYEIFSDTINYC